MHNYELVKYDYDDEGNPITVVVTFGSKDTCVAAFMLFHEIMDVLFVVSTYSIELGYMAVKMPDGVVIGYEIRKRTSD